MESAIGFPLFTFLLTMEATMDTGLTRRHFLSRSVAPILENFAGFLRKTNRAAVAQDMEARARTIRAKRAEIAPAK
jgi:hypothetical protein